VDCRTPEERNPKSDSYIGKSRYSGMNHYLSDHQYVKEHHLDGTPLKINQEFVDFLGSENVEGERLKNHIASLFSRDPIPAYSNEFEVTNK